MKKEEKGYNHLSRSINRMETLRRIKDDWQGKGIQCQLDIVVDAGHEREKTVEAVVEFLRPHIMAATQKLEHGE